MQILSWNGQSPSLSVIVVCSNTLPSQTDYGESHYIGPIKGAQPNSQAWVDGFPHTPWLHLTRDFARAFKEGAYAPVERDRIYMWARPHLRDAHAPGDPTGKPDGWQLVRGVLKKQCARD